MKFTPSPLSIRRKSAALAASIILACGGTLLAQSGGAGASSYNSKGGTPSSDISTTGTNANERARQNNNGIYSGTTPNSTGGNADVQATHDINATSTASTGAGAMTGRDTMSHDKLSWGDRRFVTKAADGGMAEVQVAELAAQQASNAEVKSFAQKLVDDHTKVNSELMGIASTKNVKLDADKDHDRSYKRLAKKSGMDFDHEFVEHMIDEHEKDIKMFEKASQDAKDPDVKAFAAKHVDHLREHLRMAEGLRQTVVPTGRMSNDSGRSTPGGMPSTPSNSNTSRQDTGSSTRPSPSTDTPPPPR